MIETQPGTQPLRAHPVLLDEPLAPHASQVAVLPGQLRLALLQRHHQLAPLHLYFQVEEVKGGICLNILGEEKYRNYQIRFREICVLRNVLGVHKVYEKTLL